MARDGTRVVEGNVHRRSRQAKAAVGEQRAIARVLVDSPAAHLRGDRRGLEAKCDRGKPHKKCQRWDGCDEANVGRERASGEHVASARSSVSGVTYWNHSYVALAGGGRRA